VSFLSDLFHGRFENLGTDITHAPSSLARHPLEIAETAAAIAAPFLLPEIGAGVGALAGVEAGADTGVVASLGGGLGADEVLGGAASALPEAASPASGFLDIPGVTASGTAANAFDPIYDAAGLNTFSAGTTPFSLEGQAAGIGPGGAFGPEGAFGGSSGVTAFAPDVTPVASSTSTDLAGQLGLNDIGGEIGKTAATGAGDSASGGTGFLDKLVQGAKDLPGNAVNQITKNPLGIGLAGAGLAYTMSQGQKQLPEQKALTDQAQKLTEQGQQFMKFLQTGTLPAGLQASVDQAKSAAKAAIISRHAAQGQSTDPNQNSALQQELAQADQNALIAVAQEGASLFQAGANEVQLSSQIYERLMQIDQQQTQNMGKSIANFASALGTGSIKAAA
jgi:hypothetical protein